VDNLAAFPFPSGVQTVMDTDVSDDGFPSCHHRVVIPSGGFSVPHFDIPALNYCSEIITLGCESGGGDGKGNLWDGNGTAASMTNVTKDADTNDGVCDNSFDPGAICVGGSNAGNPCAAAADCPGGACPGACDTEPGNPGGNTVGQVVTTRSAGGTSGVRSALDIRVNSITWSDSLCSPAVTPGCCVTSLYGDDTIGNGELKITEFEFILSPTTDVATGAFVDLNSDGCFRAGSGFNTPAPNGPKTLTGTAAAGPCCTVGQATNVVSLGVGFSGGAPLYDLGFQSTIPNTVASCDVPVGGESCVLTTDPCLGSPSGAFVDALK